MSVDMEFTAVRVRDLEVFLELCSRKDASTADWERRLEKVRELVHACAEDTSKIRTLVLSDGGAPNARQRTDLHAAFRQRQNKTAVITTSIANPLIQGVATAFSWLNPSFRAVGPERWHHAFEHLDLHDDVDLVLDQLHKLEVRMPTNKTLAIVTAKARR